MPIKTRIPKIKEKKIKSLIIPVKKSTAKKN